MSEQMVVEDFRESWQGMAEHSSSVCGRGRVAESLHTTANQEAQRVHQETG